MTRLIFDGAYIAVLVDVIVLSEYQGHGIGKTMIEKALAYLKNNIANDEQVLVMLMCAKGKEGFYEKMGFIKRPDETYGAGMSQWLLK
jgi:GNAT superfamily N-acetyltransferase